MGRRRVGCATALCPVSVELAKRGRLSAQAMTSSIPALGRKVGVHGLLFAWLGATRRPGGAAGPDDGPVRSGCGKKSQMPSVQVRIFGSSNVGYQRGGCGAL